MLVANQMPFYAGKSTSIYFLGFSLKVSFYSKIYSNLNVCCSDFVTLEISTCACQLSCGHSNQLSTSFYACICVITLIGWCPRGFHIYFILKVKNQNLLSSCFSQSHLQRIDHVHIFLDFISL